MKTKQTAKRCLPTKVGTLFLALVLLSVAGCGNPILRDAWSTETKPGTVGPVVDPGTDTPAPGTTAFSDLSADGSDTVTTTKLTLTFGRDIDGLTADDITIDAGSTGTIKGTLTGTGTGIYELGVGGISAGGSVTVTPAKAGYAISPASKTVTVYYYSSPSDTPAAFSGITANGSAAETTTKLTLTFDQDIAGLTAADITLDAGSTGAVKGAMTKTGTGTYDLGVSGISAGGGVTAAAAKAGYAISPASKPVAVYYCAIAADFISIAADGSYTATTTKLTLTFNKDIEGLTADDIEITNTGSTGAVKGILTGTGAGTYELGVSGISAGGSVTVKPEKAGYDISTASKTVFVYFKIEKRDMVRAPPGSDATVTITGDSAYSSTGVFQASRKVTLSAFQIATYETTYELWYNVRQWAIADARGENK
jgi:hypothetical protein